ncbi:hypothetical protein ATG_01080 [Desulfurococcaceae archaeon AG1]|nr:hypothetical protein ATG_01080 [Desulfurococcaceae archaeon AG1]
MVKMPRCDICSARDAVVYQTHTGLRLCKACFFSNVIARVSREIFRYGMIKHSDRILIGVSGGKDSFVLLDILSQIHEPSRLGGATIIEGIDGYNRAEHIAEIKRMATERGVELHVVSIKELWGASVDEMVRMSIEKGQRISPCTYCGIHRRKSLNLIARELGYNKVATAHNLDDEVQTIVINILRGDIARLYMNHPLRPKGSGLFIDKIKPLRKIYEWETAKYAYLASYKPQEVECPYLELFPSLRARVRDMIYRIEASKPGSMLRLLEWFDNVFNPLKQNNRETPKLGLCSICGEPTSPNRSICKSCELQIKSLGEVKIARSVLKTQL